MPPPLFTESYCCKLVLVHGWRVRVKMSGACVRSGSKPVHSAHRLCSIRAIIARVCALSAGWCAADQATHDDHPALLSASPRVNVRRVRVTFEMSILTVD